MNRALGVHSVVSASPDHLACDLDGETVILHLTRGRYYGLDPVGAEIWKLIARPTPVLQVREAILQEFDVEPERCEQDLLALLGQLADEGLIEVLDGAPL
ncbi:MAG TPA: PqqD family peptide modification chaperone [Armatimonadota bacterium]|nr:PqqD family peptide modification chaperone [Armatimonadota bacterium]